MIHNFFSLFSNPILQNALLAGLLASISSGVMGSYVVIKKISSISGSIAHSILGGVGISFWLQYKYNLAWLSPIYGAFVAAIISALLIGWMHLKHAQQEDAAIATIWSTGMGIGAIFISMIPSHGEDFVHFLFGDILAVTDTHLYILLFFDLLILLTVFVFYRRFLAICFDEEQAILQHLHIKRLYLLLLILISISIVLLIQTIGVILVIALVTIPPTIAKIFTKKFFYIMIVAFLLCAFLTFFGTTISYTLQYPPGAITAVLAAILYIISLIGKKKIFKKFS